MTSLMVQLWKEEEGSILQYLILVAIVAVLAAFLFPVLRQNVSNWFTDLILNEKRAISGTGGPSTGNTGAGF